MVPNPILIRSAQRSDGSRVVILEEIVGQEGITHSLELDDLTFQGIERAFQMHPFPRKQPAKDIVLLKSLDTPMDTDQKYIGLEIVNQGSRRHLRIEASAEAFAKLKKIFESWSARMKTAGSVGRPPAR